MDGKEISLSDPQSSTTEFLELMTYYSLPENAEYSDISWSFVTISGNAYGERAGPDQA